MSRTMPVAVILTVLWITGCSSLHDKQGWEHKAGSETDQNKQPSIFEHKH